MKIIGSTRTGWLLDATGEETSNLMGYRGNYERRERDKSTGYDLKVGDAIPIGAMFDRLYRMANMERELTEISAKLKAASDFVNTALPTIQRVSEKKEEG